MVEIKKKFRKKKRDIKGKKINLSFMKARKN